MKPWILLLIASAVLFLSGGCVQFWYQEDKTFEQARKDKIDCMEEMKKRTDFTNTGYGYETKFMENCMKEKGYKLVTEDKLPLDAKRDTKDSIKYWGALGIAGRLDSKQ